MKEKKIKKLTERKRTPWILYISRRFAKVDSTGRYAINSFFASAGIAFGVTALIVIISVMNGFQMGYIDSIMEISSFHVRIENPTKESTLLLDTMVLGLETMVDDEDYAEYIDLKFEEV